MRRKLIIYLLAGIGVLIGQCFAAAVVVDVFLYEHGKTTISEWFLAASIHKKCLVVGIAALNAFVWGALYTHLIWARSGSSTFWLLILVVTELSLIAGGFFGHYFFGQ